jgi:hypothetical protein
MNKLGWPLDWQISRLCPLQYVKMLREGTAVAGRLADWRAFNPNHKAAYVPHASVPSRELRERHRHNHAK